MDLSGDNSQADKLGSETEQRDLDEVLEHLRMFASIKDNEKISTQCYVYINKPNDHLTWLRRTWSGDSREQNLKFIEGVFTKAFKRIGFELERLERTHKKDPQTLSQLRLQVENKQIIERLQKAVQDATDRIFARLKVTYQDDSTFLSRVDTLLETVQLKLRQVKESVIFLEEISTR